MYLAYYGLREPPFSITPDPRFVHLSERHRDALAHLLFGIDKGGGGGFVQLTGEVGTGKTTLSRLLLEQLPDNARIALVLNPRQNPVELLETICEELRIAIEGKRGSSKALIDALNAYLLDAYAQGLKVVLLIDEAQNLPADTLEQVRLLTNLETATQKLLQILLLGQPELRDTLARPELRQLAQRITGRFHLLPLDAAETDAYLRHRWRVAGGTRFPFDARAVQTLHARAGGVPRLINVIAERALLAGYARDALIIDHKLVTLAANELLPPTPPHTLRRLLPIAAAALAIATSAALAWSFWPRPTAPPSPALSNTQGQTATAQPSPVTTQAPTLDHVLASAPPLLSNWQQLLALWSLPGHSITVAPSGACTPASNFSFVHCASGRATLDALAATDRPSLLRLHTQQQQAWALLIGLDARRVRLQLGQQILNLERSQLLTHWDGSYASVWRGAEALQQPPLPDSSGRAVDWLWLKLLPNEAAQDKPYNATLRTAVRNAQMARGLPADGIAGALTLMALSNGLPGPRLQRTLE